MAGMAGMAMGMVGMVAGMVADPKAQREHQNTKVEEQQDLQGEGGYHLSGEGEQ